MEALVARLSQLDPEAEGALRVVMFYDTLMRRRVDLPALARASAGLAECVAGVHLHSTGRTIRVEPDGRAAVESPASSEMSITLDDEEIGTVWLERHADPGPLDDTLLERFAIAAAAVVERFEPARTTMADPALLELVISRATDEAARVRALRLLGFAPEQQLTVAAVRSSLPLDRIGRAICPARLVKAAVIGDVGVIVATAIDPGAFPNDVRAGLGAAGSPDRPWRDARTALRFTHPYEPVIRYDQLGALALLAEISPGDVRNSADVAAIARLADSPEAMQTLDAYCATGSVRKAASLLHLHHASVARRIDQIGRFLGLQLTEPTGLFRANLARTAWRLRADY